VEAGGIDEVDFDALPLDKGNGVLHGCAAGDFFFVIGSDGGSIGHTALVGVIFAACSSAAMNVVLPLCACPLQLRCGSHFPGRFSLVLHLRWFYCLRLARVTKRRGNWVEFGRKKQGRAWMGSYGLRLRWSGVRGRSGMAQGRLAGVVEGVHVAELAGHVSRSAVSLIHIEVRTGAGNRRRAPPGVYR